MDRLVEAEHPIHDLLRRRWSPRAFAERPVEPQKLRSLLEAARWTPSCFNEQPWSFIVATKLQPQEFARMLACLAEKNQTWAAAAPVLMISVANRNFQRNDKPNRHAFHDVGAAAAYLTMQATALDLYVHQMAGFSAEHARQTYGILESAEAVAAIAVGYLGDPASLPEEFREKETVPTRRKPITEFVFTGRWGEAAPWTQE